MAAIESTMVNLGMLAPNFQLQDFNGKTFKLNDFRDAKALLIAFICPHCPFVKHVRTEFSRFTKEYAPKGVAVVAIAANDIEAYPQDGPQGMAQEAKEAGYTFPYLLDETQQVAKAYQAACTPDFFLFDQNQLLVYRGQFDNSRPGNNVPVDGADLRQACDAVLSGQPVSTNQKPSIGCNIKWKQ